MYLLIFGSRTFNDYELMCRVLDDLYPNRSKIEIIEGEAPGADRMSKRWAKERGVPVLPMPADWSRNGGAAGFLRNSMMVEHCTEAVGFWDGKSRGTKDTIDKLKAKERKCTIVYFTPKNDDNSQKNDKVDLDKIEIVPLIAPVFGDESINDQPCKFGLRAGVHAVYCQNKNWPDAPRKCRRSWYSGGKTRDEDCPGFEKNEKK